VWQDYGAGEPWSRELRVAGVLPREFVLLSRSVDYLQPFDIESRAAEAPDSRDFAVIGRLKPELSLERAQAQADVFSRRLEDATGSARLDGECGSSPRPRTHPASSAPVLLALLAAVGVLVLILR
jgi:hypothetical protein